MRKRLLRQRLPAVHFLDRSFFSVLLCICFGLGALIGFLLGFFSRESGSLSAYLQNYFSVIADNDAFSVNLWLTVWEIVRWPLLAVILGMTRINFIALPALLFVRAFLLSHAITVFSVLFGRNGFLVSLLVFGITALLVIPVCFVICCDNLQKNGFALSRERLPVYLVCTGLLALATAMQQSLIPSLISAFCSSVPII